MEEEISLKELITMLWGGRYLIIVITATAVIIALVASLFLITPLYEAKSRIDLIIYDISTEEFISCLEEPGLQENAEEMIGADLLTTADNIKYTADNSAVLVTVQAASPDKANQAAAQIGTELFEQAGSYCLEQLHLEKEQLESSLMLLEEEKKAYSPDPAYYLEKLTSEKKAAEESIAQLQAYIDNLRGEMELEEQLQMMEIDPSYRVLMEKMGELLTRHAEISMQINDVKAGRFTEELLEEDSYYTYLLERKENLDLRFSDVVFSIRTTELTMASTPPEHNFSITPAADQPVNRNWALNTAVAGVLGLMVSVFIVFARPHVKELFNVENSDENTSSS